MQSTTSAMLAAIAMMVVATPTNAQIPFLGSCPQMEVVQNFNVSAYLGKWYEQERYFAIFELGADCVTATYTDEGNGVVGVNNENTNIAWSNKRRILTGHENYCEKYSTLRCEIPIRTNKKSSIKGKATLVGNDGEAKLQVVFPSVENFGAPYWILETDYTRYAIVWSCSGLLGANAQFAWILTREKNPGLEVLAEIKEKLEKHSVPTKPFLKTKQICEDN